LAPIHPPSGRLFGPSDCFQSRKRLQTSNNSDQFAYLMYFKIFTKVAVRRLTQVAEKLISHSQTAFIPKRNILEGAVILHETIHELHRKKMNELILKIEFKKAYEKVKRGFLQQTLRIKGFSKNSANGFLNLLLGSVGIKVRVLLQCVQSTSEVPIGMYFGGPVPN
jgi:hypothetical protein